MPSLAIVRLALTAWYAFQLLERADEPKPRDSPEIRSLDPAADRVLLVGNGLCFGWGVLTHQLGLPGQLSRALRARTGRPCDVDYVGAESMNVQSARSWLGHRNLTPYDAVIIAIGVNDAVRRTPVATWRTALSELITTLRSRLRPDAQVYVTGIPPIRSVSGYDNFVGRLAEPQRRRLQAATVEIIEDAALPDLIELGAPAIEDEDAAARYAAHAATLADQLAPHLLCRSPVESRPPFDEPESWTWPGAATLIREQETGGAPALRELVERAQKRFRVEFAIVSLINGDRIWHAVNTEVFPPSVPLDLSFCKYPIESGEALIVGNTALDSRFADNPLKQISFINFYAGVPIEDSSGTVIGSFCLQGSRPRSARRFPLGELREMALEAQTELRRYESSGARY